MKSLALALALFALLAACTAGGGAATSTPTPTPARSPTLPTPAASTPTPAISTSATPATSATVIAAPSGQIAYVIQPGSKASYVAREQLAGKNLPNDAIGTATGVAGAIVVGPGNSIVPGLSRITVDLRGLKSDDDRRDGFIQRNPLQTSQFPLAEFAVKEIIGLASARQGMASFRLVGDMTIHGVTKSQAWDVTVQSGDGQVVGTAATSFKFEDYGMSAPKSFLVLSVEDTVHLKIDLILKPDSKA